MSENNKFINKNDFLEATRGGFDFYNFVMRKQGVNLHIKESNNSLKNPFYNDTKGSLSINYQNDEYLFNDFGDTRFRGDVLNFAGFYYNLNPNTELQQILINCCKDLNLNNLLVVKNSTGIKAVIERDKFLEFEKEYWANYGISTEILNKYDAVSVDYILLSKSNNKLFSNKKNPIFAFKELERSKIYQPFSKKFKHQWFPKKKIDIPFGYKQLENQGDLLIIAAGEKDVLALASQGYSAISLNSETQTNFNKDLLNDLSSRFRTIAVLYDIDETGKKAAKQLSEKYTFSIIELPNELSELGFGKDVSDYFKAVLSGANPELFNLEKFRKLVANTKKTEIIIVNENMLEVSNNNSSIMELQYSYFPDFIESSLELFNSKTEKDMILISLLGVTSGCLPKYQSYYLRSMVFPNIYTFIIGPAASGKGVVNFTKQLGLKINEELQKNNQGKDKAPKTLFLPANSSKAGLLELLSENNGTGIIFETEADTLAGIFKNKEFGDSSDIHRKASHHESLSSYRKTDKLHIYIRQPKLSEIICGTPNQVYNLIPNNEDGLFSRYIYYLFDQPAFFCNVFEDITGKTEEFFYKQSIEMKLIYDTLLGRVKPLIFRLSKKQQDEFTEYMSDLLDFYIIKYGTGCSAIVKRFGLAFHRIMMILTLFRNINNLADADELIGLDEDFYNVIKISKSLIHNSIQLYLTYPIQNKGYAKLLKNHQKNFFDGLPNEFKREDALKMMYKNNISESTMDRWFRDGKLFEKIKQGIYKKNKL